MTKKVNYYLDQTDQIKVDGHTLSRLYLAEPYPELESNKRTRYAIYGHDNSDRTLGGYIENLDLISDEFANNGKVAWIDKDSVVYGNSHISSGASIIGSTIVDSEVRNGTYPAYISNSSVIRSIAHEVYDSTRIDITCFGDVCKSHMTNSTVTRGQVTLSTLRDVHITGSKNTEVRFADAKNVRLKGSLYGTFANVSEDEMTIHNLYCNTPYGVTERVRLLVGPDGHLATCNSFGEGTDRFLPAGDTTKDELLGSLKHPMGDKTVGTEEAIEIVESLTPEITLSDSDFDLDNTLEL